MDWTTVNENILKAFEDASKEFETMKTNEITDLSDKAVVMIDAMALIDKKIDAASKE